MKIRMMMHVLTLSSLFVAAHASADPSTDAARVERGRYLVAIGGCNDCHTPLKMGPNGPERDQAFLLAGHPATMEAPATAPGLEGGWMAATDMTMTVWTGPWGTTYTANLTSDVETGLGAWKPEEFVAMARSGRHLGKGRPILPPMPTEALRAMSDEDLLAIFAYLQTVPPVRNKVPAPVAPAAGRS